MADPYDPRTRPGDQAYDREPLADRYGEQPNDPLAELARLIGQSDPYHGGSHSEYAADRGYAPSYDASSYDEAAYRGPSYKSYEPQNDHQRTATGDRYEADLRSSDGYETPRFATGHGYDPDRDRRQASGYEEDDEPYRASSYDSVERAANYNSRHWESPAYDRHDGYRQDGYGHESDRADPRPAAYDAAYDDRDVARAHDGFPAQQGAYDRTAYPSAAGYPTGYAPPAYAQAPQQTYLQPAYEEPAAQAPQPYPEPQAYPEQQSYAEPPPAEWTRAGWQPPLPSQPAQDDGWPKPAWMTSAPETKAAPPRASAPAYDPFAAPVHQVPDGGRRYDPQSYTDPRAPLPPAAPPAFHSQTYATAPRDPYAAAAEEVARTGSMPDTMRGSPVQMQTAGVPMREPRMDGMPSDAYASAALGPVPSFLGKAQQTAAHPEQNAPPFQMPPPFSRAGREPPPDDFYQDGERRRRSLVPVLAVLALAFAGTAGAFAYRSVFGTSSAGPPPVIRASTEPTKVVPPPQPVADTAKLAYDRFGDRSQNEKLVPREEKPVDINSLVRSSEPRVVLPGAPTAGAGSPGQGAANYPPNIISEPRRVRAVPIRPDQELPAVPQASTLPPPQVSPRNAVASAQPSSMPLEVTPQAVPSPQAPVRNVPARPTAAPSNAPLALTPDANASAAAPPPAPVRVASAPSSGGFVVQVSSQRSEADAQAAYRNIQSRYSSVLGGQPSFVRRADLGDRGTFYRAMVGPFANRNEAVQLCASLKSAGGDCVVQSN